MLRANSSRLGRSGRSGISLAIAVCVSASVIASGCGSAMPVSKKTTSPSVQFLSDTASTTLDPSSAGGEAYRVKIQGKGYDTHTVTLQTGRTLKVRFIPGKQNRSDDSGFFQYSMMGVYVGIGDATQPTELVYNGYGGGSAQQSSVIDLSDFVPACASPACRQSVTITVTKPNNDDGCRNLSYAQCPYNRVPDGHSWNGTLVIQTDDTAAI